VGGLGRRLALLAALEFVLFILQSVFVAMRTSAPEIAALHPVNGFLILLIALVIVRESWAARALEPAIADR
jgi:cytochrome b561